MVKLLDKIEENTHARPQETLEFRVTKQKQSFDFDKPFIIPRKWVMGVTSLQIYNRVYNITEKILNSNIIYKVIIQRTSEL